MYPVSKKNVLLPLLMAGIILLSACASQESVVDRPTIDWAMIKKSLNCPFGTTPACVERVGQIQGCVCSDEDALRQILEPTRHP